MLGLVSYYNSINAKASMFSISSRRNGWTELDEIGMKVTYTLN